MTFVKTENVTKTFRNHEVSTTALREVNITIDEGEFVSIMGPSGCGKTTLLNIIGMIDTPSKGAYLFKNLDTTSLSERKKTQLRKENIGFVFQSFNLIDDLTIYENVELPLLYMKIKARDRRKQVLEILERLQIAHYKKYFPQQLSGGQQQRVALARAIINKPEILLADEPTGNLDSVNGEEVMKILDELNQNGTTILMVTHSPSYANRAQRIIHLFDGHIITENIKHAI